MIMENCNRLQKTATLISILFLAVLISPFNLYFDNEFGSKVSHLTYNQGISILEKGVNNTDLMIINAGKYNGDNDKVKLQAALDDVPEEGAIVLIDSRVWVAAGLKAKSNTIILGMNGTFLKRPENNTEPFITFVNASNFAILNLTFEGGDIENAYGIMIINCQNFIVQNNTFYNLKESSIKVTLTVDGYSCNFAVINNSFFNCQNVPIHVFGIPSRRAIRNFLISNNTVINGTKNGKIGVAFSANGIIDNNKIIDCEHGIATRNISNITITNNHLVNITNYGIYLGTQIGDYGTDDVKIEKNIIYNAKIGICRYYGSYPLTKINVINNQFIKNRELDILADFPGLFINNTITEAAKLKIKDPTAIFKETKTIFGQLVLPGDFNNDLRINIKDVALVATCFGSREGSANWNEKADIISDGKIDMKDLSYVAKNFGLTAVG